MLQSDVKDWVSEQLGAVHAAGKGKDPVIPEIKALVAVLRMASTVITPIYSITQYFSRIGIDYFKVVSLTIDSKVL